MDACEVSTARALPPPLAGEGGEGEATSTAQAASPSPTLPRKRGRVRTRYARLTVLRHCERSEAISVRLRVHTWRRLLRRASISGKPEIDAPRNDRVNLRGSSPCDSILEYFPVLHDHHEALIRARNESNVLQRIAIDEQQVCKRAPLD